MNFATTRSLEPRMNLSRRSSRLPERFLAHAASLNNRVLFCCEGVVVEGILGRQQVLWNRRLIILIGHTQTLVLRAPLLIKLSLSNIENGSVYRTGTLILLYSSSIGKWVPKKIFLRRSSRPALSVSNKTRLSSETCMRSSRWNPIGRSIDVRTWKLLWLVERSESSSVLLSSLYSIDRLILKDHVTNLSLWELLRSYSIHFIESFLIEFVLYQVSELVWWLRPELCKDLVCFLVWVCRFEHLSDAHLILYIFIVVSHDFKHLLDGFTVFVLRRRHKLLFCHFINQVHLFLGKTSSVKNFAHHSHWNVVSSHGSCKDLISVEEPDRSVFVFHEFTSNL